MAESTTFPQIPSSVWWGVRSLLIRKPSLRINATTLATELGVQPAAAKAYLRELINSGILDDDGKATQVALSWRTDEGYVAASETLLRNCYPEQLVELIDPIPENRSKVVNWFTHQGLGSGSAGNKAATYLLIGAKEPLDLTTQNNIPKKERSDRPSSIPAKAAKPGSVEPPTQKRAYPNRRAGIEPQLNINIQTHISAEATNEQINTIFAAMRQNLYED